MPTTQGYDPGFVGAAYEAPNYLQDTQRCINWYPEISPDPHAKEVIGLLGAPGTLDLVTLLAGKPVRQAWVLPGGIKALAVSGANVYLVTQDATLNLIAVQVGTLLTPIGPVQIRDNGYVAVIVDGAYGYTYLINTGAFAQITDAGFTGFASRIAMIDGWFIFNQANSRNFYLSPQYLGINGNPNQGLQNTKWDPTAVAVADATGDLLVSLIEDQRLLWLPKERATEVWYDAGAQFFTFNRMQGVLLQIGCAAPQSVTRVSKGLMWLAANERGQNFVIRTQGFDYDRVSTHAIDFAISSYATVADALGWSYIENGHEFYVLTFPTADVTWVYDTGTGLWHERLSFNPTLGQYHRHRGNCVINFINRRLIGTWDTGALAWLDRSLPIDGGNPLVSWRRTGHIWDKQSRRRIFHHQLQIETAPGVGTAGTPGFISNAGGSGSGGGALDPNVMLLLHCDGANGATTTTDVYGAPIVFLGAATLSTAQAKFGQSSLRIPSVGANGIQCGTAPGSVRIPTSEYTIEQFIFIMALPGVNANIFSHHPSPAFSGQNCFMDTLGRLNFLVSNSCIAPWSYVSPPSPALSLNTWHHMALVAQVNISDGHQKWTSYLDGVAWDMQIPAVGATHPCYLGGNLVYGDSSIQSLSCPGFYDEIRISLIAQYHSNFTPPTAPFSSQSTSTVARPQMILKWSDDGGKTFGNEKLMPMGQIGQYKNRSVAYNLGYSRDRVYDLKVIDAVPRDLIGATLMSEVEQ